ncbi:hypothetical protein GIB67_022784 [Kingdonia uniflora]|uniref:Uncharacterized protein n=1 Tax=Kingdonia uniflora TaxID=39325 RepID=A0A7J7P701_9MAGN|nr:hypothetical protein GIB67_022784 [Kingdonia uniflora]
MILRKGDVDFWSSNGSGFGVLKTEIGIHTLVTRASVSSSNCGQVGLKGFNVNNVLLKLHFPPPFGDRQPESLTTGLLLRARICITGAFTIVFLYAPKVNSSFPTYLSDRLVGRSLYT